MDKKAKFILDCIREEKKWIFLERVRKREFEYDDLVCFCYRDFYVKIKIEPGKFKIDKYIISIWENSDKTAIQFKLWTGNYYEHKRWARVYLIKPGLAGKFKTIIKSYD